MRLNRDCFLSLKKCVCHVGCERASRDEKTKRPQAPDREPQTRNAGCEWTSPGKQVECRDCGPGMWLNGCRGQNPGTCHPVTVAGKAEYEVSAPGRYKDREVGECADLVACSAGSWRPCGNGSMDECAACKTCPAGNYRASCGGLSEGTCQACPGCQHGFVRVGCGGVESPMSQGKCEPCGSCSSGEYRLRAFSLPPPYLPLAFSSASLPCFPALPMFCYPLLLLQPSASDPLHITPLPPPPFLEPASRAH